MSKERTEVNLATLFLNIPFPYDTIPLLHVPKCDPIPVY